MATQQNGKTTTWGFWLSLALMAVFGTANIIFSYLNYTEREEMLQQVNQSREMLNARAIIQIMLITSSAENRALTPAELTQINRLWVTAEFDTERRPTQK